MHEHVCVSAYIVSTYIYTHIHGCEFKHIRIHMLSLCAHRCVCIHKCVHWPMFTLESLRECLQRAVHMSESQVFIGVYVSAPACFCV